MVLAMTGGDALRFTVAGTEVQHLEAFGTVSGVVIESASATNGPGTGMVRNRGLVNGTAKLSWKAPGSSAFGDDVPVSADGSHLLLDGDDLDKWVRVGVTTTFLTASEEMNEVLLRDVFENEIGDADVTAAEASAGDVKTYTVDMKNVGTVALSAIVVWIDAAVTGIEISDDGIVWVSPTTEATGLKFPDLSAGATDTLHLRRTIAASSPSDDGVLNHLHAVFDGL